MIITYRLVTNPICTELNWILVIRNKANKNTLCNNYNLLVERVYVSFRYVYLYGVIGAEVFKVISVFVLVLYHCILTKCIKMVG